MTAKKSKTKDKLHGNPGKRKKQYSKVFETSVSLFDMPRGLSKDIRVKVRHIINYLKDNGLSRNEGRMMFMRYCEHMRLFDDAKEDIKENGLYVTLVNETKWGTNEKLVVNPSVRIMKENSAAAFDIEKAFAIPPTLWDKMPEKQEDGKDLFEEYMKSGGKPKVVK